MATLGDPLADLGLTLVYWTEPGEEGWLTPAGSRPATRGVSTDATASPGSGPGPSSRPSTPGAPGGTSPGSVTTWPSATSSSPWCWRASTRGTCSTRRSAKASNKKASPYRCSSPVRTRCSTPTEPPRLTAAQARTDIGRRAPVRPGAPLTPASCPVPAPPPLAGSAARHPHDYRALEVPAPRFRRTSGRIDAPPGPLVHRGSNKRNNSAATSAAMAAASSAPGGSTVIRAVAPPRPRSCSAYLRRPMLAPRPTIRSRVRWCRAAASWIAGRQRGGQRRVDLRVGAAAAGDQPRSAGPHRGRRVRVVAGEDPQARRRRDVAGQLAGRRPAELGAGQARGRRQPRRTAAGDTRRPVRSGKI